MPTGYTYSLPTPGAPALLGAVVIEANNNAMTVNGSAKTIVASGTSGYLTYSDVAADSLIARIATQITSVGALAAFAITLDYATGKLTWNNVGNGVNATLVFDPDLIGYLGLSAATLVVTAGQSSVSPNQCRGLYLPGKFPATQTCADGARGEAVTDGRTTESTDGTTYTSYSATWYENELEWHAIARALIWQTFESPMNASYERFWGDCIRPGRRIRYTPDGSVPASYVTYRPRQDSTTRLGLRRTVDAYDGLWDLRLALRTGATG